MLTLRLARAGTKKRPVYHLVAADSRARRDGRFIENLGYYAPGRKIMVLKQDRIQYWLGVGAQPSETAGALIKRGQKEGNHEVQAKPKYVPPAVKPVEPKAEAPKAEEPKAEAAAAEAPAAEAPAAAAEAPAEPSSEN